MTRWRAWRGACDLRAVATAVATLALASCSEKPPPPVRGQLEGDTIARVGDELITREMVTTIARAQGVSAREALDLAIFDALAASEARATTKDAPLRRRVNGALARTLIQELATEARAEGPPTDAEIGELSKQRWYEVARPEGAIGVHAVVRLSPDASADEVERATALARKIQEAVADSAKLARETVAPDNTPRRGLKAPPDPARDRFLQLASTVPSGALKVSVEPLDLLGKDGFTLNLDRRVQYDPAFVEGIFKLPSRGALSEPFRSSFGLHVVLLLDRVPGNELSLEQRRQHFESEVMHRRTTAKVDALLGQLRASTPVEQDAPTVEGLLEQVKLGP